MPINMHLCTITQAQSLSHILRLAGLLLQLGRASIPHRQQESSLPGSIAVGVQRIIVTAGSLSEAEAALKFSLSDGETSELQDAIWLHIARSRGSAFERGVCSCSSLVLGLCCVCWTSRAVTACIRPGCVTVAHSAQGAC